MIDEQIKYALLCKARDLFPTVGEFLSIYSLRMRFGI